MAAAAGPDVARPMMVAAARGSWAAGATPASTLVVVVPASVAAAALAAAAAAAGVIGAAVVSATSAMTPEAATVHHAAPGASQVHGVTVARTGHRRTLRAKAHDLSRQEAGSGAVQESEWQSGFRLGFRFRFGGNRSSQSHAGQLRSICGGEDRGPRQAGPVTRAILRRSPPG